RRQRASDRHDRSVERGPGGPVRAETERAHRRGGRTQVNASPSRLSDCRRAATLVRFPEMRRRYLLLALVLAGCASPANRGPVPPPAYPETPTPSESPQASGPIRPLV